MSHKEYKKDELRQAFDELNPSEAQSEKIWQKLQNTGTEVNKKRSILRRTAVAAIAVLVLSVSGIGIYAAASGKFLNLDRETEPLSSTEIIYQAEQMGELLNHAPDILYLDEKQLVFGNVSGLIVYDLKEEEVLGTVDLQSIGCVYLEYDPFDDGIMQTCVVRDGDLLFIFNEKNGEPTGEAYTVLVEKTESRELTPEKAECDGDTLQKYAKAWSAQQKKMCETGETFRDNDTFEPIMNQYRQSRAELSSMSIVWTNEAGEENTSFLVIKEESYFLYTYQENQKELKETPLLLGNAGDVIQEEDLPEFIYSDDEILETIYQYDLEQDSDCYYSDKNTVTIPAHVILKEVEKDDELLVFGDFWSNECVRYGSVLIDIQGGESCSVCYHLKKSADGYRVVSVDEVLGDCDDLKMIKEYTKGYWGLYRKFKDYNTISKKRQEALIENLQSYILMNDLDIRYYQRSQMSKPVEIFTE
jgi:hypothetical protein